MNSKDINLLYEEYLASNDKTLDVDGVIYYKIIEKADLGLLQTIQVPQEMFDRITPNLMDELGNIITVGPPAHMSFRGEIPQWYLNTCTLKLENIDVNTIGNYVRAIY